MFGELKRGNEYELRGGGQNEWVWRTNEFLRTVIESVNVPCRLIKFIQKWDRFRRNI
jgi:hypothetical protein